MRCHSQGSPSSSSSNCFLLNFCNYEHPHPKKERRAQPDRRQASGVLVFFGSSVSLFCCVLAASMAEVVAPQLFTCSTVCKYAEHRPKKRDLYGQRNIFLYWDKAIAGMESLMPSIVSASVESWCSQNPIWRVHLLSREAESHYLSDACLALADRCKSVQTWSDVIRTDLLHQYGGVWADATSLCVVPLDDFLPDRSAFTLFRRPQGNYCG